MVYVYIYMCVCRQRHIHRERERESYVERWSDMETHVCICACNNALNFIHVYVQKSGNRTSGRNRNNYRVFQTLDFMTFTKSQFCRDLTSPLMDAAPTTHACTQSTAQTWYLLLWHFRMPWNSKGAKLGGPAQTSLSILTLAGASLGGLGASQGTTSFPSSFMC